MVQEQAQIEQIEKIREYVLNYISPCWRTKLLPFLKGGEFTKILEALIRAENRPLTPAAKIWFRAFKETPYENLRVVILGQDPYPQPGVATGLAFESLDTTQPSLTKIYEAIGRTFYPLDEYGGSNDLTRWTSQGVMLLNTSLTTKLNVSNAHQKIWAPFTEYVLETINEFNPFTIFVLWGGEAQKYESLLSPFTQHVIKAEHPVYASYQRRNWDCNNCFNKINQLLEAGNGREFKIVW